MAPNGDMSNLILSKAAEVKAKVSTDVLADLTDRELGLVQTAAIIEAVAVADEKNDIRLAGHREKMIEHLDKISDAVKEKKTTIDWTSLMKVGGLSGAIIGGIIGGIVYAVKVIGG